MTIDWTPFFISIRLGLTVTAILFIICLPIAALFAYTRFKGKMLIETAVTLPMVLPPTVIGFYALIMMSPYSGIGKWLNDWFQIRLAFRFGGMVLASCLFSFPFMEQSLKNGFLSVERSIIEASYVCGKSRWETFLRVILPNMKPQMLTGIILTFAHTMGSFGVVLMVGGNIPGKTKVASIAIYEKVEQLDFHSAHIYSLILLGFSYIILLIINQLNQKSRNAENDTY